MKQKDKELLLKDLSARLPYNVYVCFKTRYRCNAITDVLDGAIYTYIETHLLEDDDENEIDIIKPYFRPMSSMTEEEKKELSDITGGKFTYVYGILSNSYQNKDDGEWHNKCFRYVTLESIILVIDWLNAHHFDYRGLIEKGLALKAAEGMYI